MVDRALSDRELKILNCVVDSYVQTATPVGSRYLAKNYNLGISPATIRNVMNDLEEMGFLSHPHVSAGRVPSDKGYRMHVNTLMTLRALRKRDRQIIAESLQEYSGDVDEILRAASRILSKISAQLGIVLEPKFYRGVFQKIELVSVSDTRILAVISIESGLVKTIMMELESAVSRDQLEQTSWLINERLGGLSLREVKDTIDERLSDVSYGDECLVKCVLASSDRLFRFETSDGLHLGGTYNMMSNPEFADSGDVASILDLIESKESLFAKFDQSSDSDTVYVRIGSENEEDVFHRYSVVTTSYHVGNISGALGVVGPTRMHYAKIISLVDYVGGVLTRTLGEKLS